MKMKHKFLYSAAILTALSAGAVVTTISPLATPTVVEAEVNGTGTTVPTQTTVNIYKLQGDSFNGLVENKDGQALTTEQIQALGTNVKGLAGVTFKAYKVSDNATVETLKAMTEQELDAQYPNPVTTGETNSDGLVKWTVNQADNGRYWVIESKKPDTVSSALAVPFEITLPLSASNGTGYLNEVNIYPKNVTSETPKEGKDVAQSGNNAKGYKIGDEVTWILKGTIPGNIENYEAYEFSDKLDSKLDYVRVGKVIAAGTELTSTEDYTVEAPAAGTAGATVKVSFTKTGLEKIRNLVKDEVVANDGTKTYKQKSNVTLTPSSEIETVTENTLAKAHISVELVTSINETAVMGAEIKNDTQITFDNTPNQTKDPKTTPPGDTPHTDEPRVTTGGKKFKKVETGKTDGLAGAEFELYEADGSTPVKWTEDLIKANKATTDNKEKFISAQVDQPIKLKSGADGTFEIVGLAYDLKAERNSATGTYTYTHGTTTYKLKETKAPEGYVLQSNLYEFTVGQNSYYTDVVKLTPADAQNIQNTKRPSIPNTCGIGSAIFLVFGAVIMFFAAKGMKQRKN